MPLLTPKTPHIKKETPRHPWEKVINPALSHKIKYAHNTVHNIKYPEVKKKQPHKDRVKFTVVGNRVTKEFIYCSHIVKGLHKYHWQVFDEPIIRGVSTVEWPGVLHDLKLRYGGLAFCLDTQVAIIINDKFLGGDQVFRETIEAKYRYHLDLDFYKEGVDNFISYIRSAGRPCVYMHILIDEEHMGTLIFMLYSDVVPYTCENFLRLCAATKGGYSGTPIHRIVKDGWIQCGGFGLKSSELDCENYIIPHDRRGVLGMANDGRNVDCSTQFFVLLQPSPWMTHKYVAFGQLIDGEETLQTIEAVPTWYECPTRDIIIHKSGILNVECQYMPINKGTHEYVQGHIEDLVALGEVLYEELIAMVFITLEIKRQNLEDLALEELYISEEIVGEEDDDKMNIRATKRFLRKKEDVDRSKKSVSPSVTSVNSSDIHQLEGETNYEAEETYPPITVSSILVKPEKPYYLPFTDVPYPDEVDSVFDFKKFLKGDYCLESDLETNAPCKVLMPTLSYISEKFFIDVSQQESNLSLSSEDEREFKKYIKLNADRVSFAGDMIKSIAKCALGRYNIFDNTNKSDLITDEELRRFRLASLDYRAREHHSKKVSLSVPDLHKAPKKIKRRPTGFVRPEDLEKIRLLHRLSSDNRSLNDGSDSEEIEDLRKVRIAPSAIATQLHPKTTRRLTGFELPKLSDSDRDLRRPSAFRHLYENITNKQTLPMLKDLKQRSDISKTVLLTTSPDSRIKSDQNVRGKYLRHSLTLEHSYEQILNLQHGKKVAHKISSDYVKTIDQIEQKVENSIRSVEYAKARPSMSVSAYQKKNRKYEEIKNTEGKQKLSNARSHSFVGIRLPGDTPLHSITDVN